MIGMTKGSIKTGSIATILLALVILSSIPIETNVEGQTLTDGMELDSTTIYLREGMTLDPLEPPISDEYQAVVIPNGYVNKGLFGYGILPVGGVTWKSVGTWYSQPLKHQINLGGQVNIELYVANEKTNSGSPDADFTFDILKGNQVILSIYIANVRLGAGQEKITVQANGQFPAGNDTTIEAGTTLTFRILARMVDTNGAGPAVRFGTNDYPSRFTFGSNALIIHDVNIEKNGIIMEYKDAFMVPWTKLQTQIEVDRIIVPNDDMTSMLNSLNSTRQIIWARENTPGEYTILGSLGYNARENLSIVKTVKLETKSQPWFSLWNLINYFKENFLFSAFWVIALIGIFIYSRHRRQVWNRRIRNLPTDLKGENRSESKRAWRDRKKEKIREYREYRKDLIVEDEDDEEFDEEEERRFELFKKKVDQGEDVITL